jgi:hypothetical protein
VGKLPTETFALALGFSQLPAWRRREAGWLPDTPGGPPAPGVSLSRYAAYSGNMVSDQLSPAEREWFAVQDENFAPPEIVMLIVACRARIAQDTARHRAATNAEGRKS